MRLEQTPATSFMRRLPKKYEHVLILVALTCTAFVLFLSSFYASADLRTKLGAVHLE